MIAHNSSESAADKRIPILTPGAPWFLTLAAKVFWGSLPVRTVAIVACHPGEGSSFVSTALQAFLRGYEESSVTLVSANEFLASTSHERSTAGYSNTGADAQDKVAPAAIVLVDCPALFHSPSAIRVASHVDGVLLVVEDGSRSKLEIQRAVNLLESAEGRVLGVILNRRRYLLPNWLYTLLS